MEPIFKTKKEIRAAVLLDLFQERHEGRLPDEQEQALLNELIDIGEQYDACFDKDSKKEEYLYKRSNMIREQLLMVVHDPGERFNKPVAFMTPGAYDSADKKKEDEDLSHSVLI